MKKGNSLYEEEINADVNGVMTVEDDLWDRDNQHWWYMGWFSSSGFSFEHGNVRTLDV